MFADVQAQAHGRVVVCAATFNERMTTELAISCKSLSVALASRLYTAIHDESDDRDHLQPSRTGRQYWQDLGSDRPIFIFLNICTGSARPQQPCSPAPVSRGQCYKGFIAWHYATRAAHTIHQHTIASWTTAGYTYARFFWGKDCVSQFG